MAGRRVFFSFHYEQDVWRASNVRNAGKVDATSAAGWADASIWEEAKLKGRSELERLINAALRGTSVTAVLVGAETASRPCPPGEASGATAPAARPGYGRDH